MIGVLEMCRFQGSENRRKGYLSSNEREAALAALNRAMLSVSGQAVAPWCRRPGRPEQTDPTAGISAAAKVEAFRYTAQPPHRLSLE